MLNLWHINKQIARMICNWKILLGRTIRCTTLVTVTEECIINIATVSTRTL